MQPNETTMHLIDTVLLKEKVFLVLILLYFCV